MKMIIDKIQASPQLGQILVNFMDVLRIHIMMTDSEGRPILAPQNSGHGIQAALRWGAFQGLGGSGFLSQFQKEGPYLKAADQLGLHYFAVPMAAAGLDHLAYLIIGPVIINKPLEHAQYKAMAQDLGADPAEFLASLNEIRAVTFNGLKSMLDLFAELSQYALRIMSKETDAPVTAFKPSPASLSVFKNLLELSMALTQAECGSLMVFNKRTDELNVQMVKGMNLGKAQGVGIKLGEGIAGLAAQSKKPMMVQAQGQNNRIRHLMIKPELKCALIVPIIRNNKEILGVMNLSTRSTHSRLNTHGRQLLKALKDIASSTAHSLL